MHASSVLYYTELTAYSYTFEFFPFKVKEKRNAATPTLLDGGMFLILEVNDRFFYLFFFTFLF